MKATNSILCPSCKEPWVTPEGKWSICADCPHRDVTGIRGGDHSIMATVMINEDGRVSGVVDLTKLFKRLHDLEANERRLLREIADVQFRNKGAA